MTTEPEPRYKCHTCHVVIRESQFDAATKDCPNCGEKFKNLEPMCPLDHCGCSHEITQGLAYCPKCKRAVCPICGCHDVSQVSRVTGYLASVDGWNNAKQQELKDRKRTNL